VVVLRSQVANRIACLIKSPYRALAHVSLCNVNCVRVPVKGLLYLYLLLYVMLQQRTERNALRVRFENAVSRGVDTVPAERLLPCYLIVELQLFVAGFDLEICQ
jgi:hypothetical protein